MGVNVETWEFAGDASGVLAASAQIDAAMKAVKAEMRGVAQEAAGGSVKAAASLEGLARQYTGLAGQSEEYKAKLKGIADAQKAQAQASQGVTAATGVMNNTVRQAAFGISDFVTVITQPGMGLNQALRASANNAEVLLAGINPWLTLLPAATMVLSPLVGKLFEMGDATDKAKEGMDNGSKSLESWADHLEKMVKNTDEATDAIYRMSDAEREAAGVRRAASLAGARQQEADANTQYEAAVKKLGMSADKAREKIRSLQRDIANPNSGLTGEAKFAAVTEETFLRSYLPDVEKADKARRDASLRTREKEDELNKEESDRAQARMNKAGDKAFRPFEGRMDALAKGVAAGEVDEEEATRVVSEVSSKFGPELGNLFTQRVYKKFRDARESATVDALVPDFSGEDVRGMPFGAVPLYRQREKETKEGIAAVQKPLTEIRERQARLRAEREAEEARLGSDADGLTPKDRQSVEASFGKRERALNAEAAKANYESIEATNKLRDTLEALRRDLKGGQQQPSPVRSPAAPGAV